MFKIKLKKRIDSNFIQILIKFLNMKNSFDFAEKAGEKVMIITNFRN